jgi:hypothetical protein
MSKRISLTVRLSPEDHLLVSALAIEEQTSINVILAQAIKLFAKYKFKEKEWRTQWAEFIAWQASVEEMTGVKEALDE